MALSQSVEDSLKEAESNLRNALAFAARQERPMVCGVIAEIITKIEQLDVEAAEALKKIKEIL